MTRDEAEMFIDEMECIGDVWDIDQVLEVYGDKSFEEAVSLRSAELAMFFHGIESLL